MAFTEQPYGPLVDTTAQLLTWNVWGRFGPWQRRENAIVEVIAASNADVVLLQESWVDDTGADQASVLGTRLQMHHCFGGGQLLFGDWGLGNAVLSRWPIIDTKVVSLPTLQAGGWGGIALAALIDGPRGAIRAYCVALDWPPHGSAARQHALRHLAEAIEVDSASSKATLVVAGDLNAGPDSDEIRMLTGRGDTARPGFVLFDAWAAADGPGITWSQANSWAAPNLLPDQRIDYIFTGWPRRGGVGSVTSATVVGTQPIDGVLPSDHFAVAATIRY